MPEFGVGIALHGTTHQDGGDDEINVQGLSGDLADVQDPKVHASEHQNGGGDEINVQGLSGELADAQDPKAHGSSHYKDGIDELDVADLGSGVATVNQVPKADGVGGVAWGAMVGGFYNAYVCVWDKKTQNTSGGAFTSGAWRTRDINDEHADTAGICSIAGNRITLAAGTYRCLISCSANAVNHHQARLYNITDAATLLVGTSEFASATYGGVTRSFVAGRFTLAAQKVLEVQHRCETTVAGSGFGTACNFTDEIYTIAEFWREV